jgi:formylglycine-generating enzyme required for sulfatase activity
MSPESFDGNKSHQTDIWSAGVIFYELLSGKLPFHAETIFGLARAIRQSEPDPLPHTVHEGLMRFIDTALQKDLTMRFQTARDMRIALDTVANELKADLRVRADVTEKFSDLARYIDPAAVTEVIDGASAQEVINQTSSMDIAEDPMGPVQSISIETQRSMIDITGDDPSNDKDRMTSSEGARALIPPSGKPTASKRVLWITAIAGGVLVPVVGLGLLAASFSNFFMPAADNAQVGPENPAQALVKRNACGNESDTPKGMVCIPGGEFMMGRDNGEMEEEGPAFPKSVEPFYMDVHEVTNAKYAEFVQATQHDPPEGWQGTSYPNGQGNLPVVNVNWYDASKYAEWAGKRLPTEKEWEFAARGPDNRLYTWGNEWRPGFANIAMLDGAVEDVSKFADGKSPFGMLNMIGNAGEWTADDFKPYPRGKLPDRYKGQNDLKTLRGNNFGGLKEYATATFRFGYPASGAPTYDTTGFRCAKDAGRKGN